MAKTEINEFVVNRAFDHKTYGRVGIVEMSAGVSGVSINGKELPKSSIEYLLTFALQNLQDAYAGAESEADAKKRWQTKLDRLIEGTIGVRTGGGNAVSRETKVLRTIVAEQIRAKGKGEALKGLEGDARAEFLDGVFAKQSDENKAALMALVAQRIAEEDARRAQAAKLADSIEL